MDSRIEEIIEGLQRLLKNPGSSFIASVMKDNGDTVDVKDLNEVEYLQVRKIATEKAKGLILTPVTDSYVIVSRIANSDDLFVSVFSEVEKVEMVVGKVEVSVDTEAINITTGDTTIQVNKDGIICNGGKLGGLVMIKELKENLDNLKKYVEAINSALPSAFSAVGASTAANGALGAQSYQGSMVGKNIQFENMENDKVKH